MITSSVFRSPAARKLTEETKSSVAVSLTVVLRDAAHHKTHVNPSKRRRHYKYKNINFISHSDAVSETQAA